MSRTVDEPFTFNDEVTAFNRQYHICKHFLFPLGLGLWTRLTHFYQCNVLFLIQVLLSDKVKSTVWWLSDPLFSWPVGFTRKHTMPTIFCMQQVQQQPVIIHTFLHISELCNFSKWLHREHKEIPRETTVITQYVALHSLETRGGAQCYCTDCGSFKAVVV